MLATAVPLPQHRITIDDVTPELKLVAEDYARLYCGNFSFMQAMQDAVVKWKKLSDKQAAGVLNCLKAQQRFETEQAQQVEPTRFAPMLPVGTYTVAFLNAERVTLKIQEIKADELADWDFFVKGGFKAGSLKIKVLVGPDNETSYIGIGVQKQDGTLKFWKKAFDLARRGVDALLDPENAKTAGFEYAVKSSRCYRCNHKLTVPASIFNGLGPDCATKVG